MTRMCEDLDCDYCFRNNFAASDARKVACWSDERHNGVLPRQVTKLSHKLYWFTCDGPCGGHHFQISPASITNGQRCPFCAGRQLCNDTDCEYCFSHSFAASDDRKVACWSAECNSGVTPRQVSIRSNKKFWFTCNGHCGGHNFQAGLLNTTGCPYC
ncbi:hypothetical protein JKP88DRAFT_247607 [Tribonema minus]|uniref:Treble clef zinc finger domain-containing protein n=1 Tax=Tribonema minus TaxID=303371 RepID=A0A835YQ68_9STRA|nr:hypothetical protein JKP88DRAFT_247607 [Tribonema minus]